MKLCIERTILATGKRKGKVELCLPTARWEKDECAKGDVSIVPLVFIFIAQFVAGVGVLLFFSLGGPYLDDNVNKTNSPMLFGNQLLGPV